MPIRSTGGLHKGNLFDTNIPATKIDKDIFTDQEVEDTIAGDDLILMLDVSETPDKIKYMTREDFTDGLLGDFITITDNESTNENDLIPFIANASTSTGSQSLEMDGDFHYNPSTGLITATQLAGTLQTASQTNITGVGTIGTGTWQATDIGVAHGGTGVSSLTANAILTGNGTSAIQAETALLFDSNKLIPTAAAHDAAGTALSLSAGATTAGTSNNQAGGALTIQGGRGKGSGAGGAIIFQTANAGGSGSSLNALATALTINDDGSLTTSGTIELGHASDTTIARSGSGDITIEGNAVYRAGGTDVAVADGGTGASSLSNLITLTTHTTGNYVATVTGGVGIDSSGATSGEGIAHSLSIDLAEVDEVAIANGDYIAFMDATDSNATKKEALADVATLFAGTGLTASSSVIGVDASQTQITSVGALNAGSITSGFTSIDVGSGAITTTGALSIASMGTNWTNAGRTVADMGIVTTIDINGGTINGITDLAVADGGTGVSTLTDHGVVLGSGTGAVSVTGTGSSGQVLTSGGSGADPDWETPTVGDITAVTAGVGLSGGGTAGALALALDLSELSAVTPTSGDSFSTLDNDGAAEQRTTTDALATLFAGAGMTATSAVVNVIGGDGITANANDVAITPAQTTITSIYATDLILGEDAETAIDFGTANEIDFKINNTAELTLDATSLYPIADAGLDLGTASLGFNDLHIGASGIINFDNANMKITHSTGALTVAGGTFATAALTAIGALTVGVDDTGHDVKFFGASAGAYMMYDQSEDQLILLGPSADAAGSSGKLLLATAQTDVRANDILGQIEFQAPLENEDTDAKAIAAAIKAIAQDTFSASVNATDMIFYTGHSEAATEKFRITSQGELGVGGANYGSDGHVLTSTGAGTAPAWEAIPSASAPSGAQTAITTILNAGAKLGRDSQNLIDFATTDNKIILRVNNVDEVELVENALSPVTNDGVALGTTSLGWSDLHIASAGVINWANGEMTITESDANTLTVAGGNLAGTFVGDITGDVTGTADVATVATTVTITDNESTDEANAIIFTAGGDLDGGNLGLESDGTLNYNPSSGTITTTALAVATVVASGIIKTDDSTDATSTTDGSLQTDGGLSVVLDAVIGNDLHLLSDSAVLAFGGDGEATITHADDAGLTFSSDIALAADKSLKLPQGANITFTDTITQDSIDDHDAQGIIMTFQAGMTITPFSPVYLHTDDEVHEADADGIATMPCIGVSVNTSNVSDGNAVEVMVLGLIRDESFTDFGTNGAPVYVSTTVGTMTNTAPSGTDDVVQVVGHSIGEKLLFVQPCLTTIEHA